MLVQAGALALLVGGGGAFAPALAGRGAARRRDRARLPDSDRRRLRRRPAGRARAGRRRLPLLARLRLRRRRPDQPASSPTRSAPAPRSPSSPRSRPRAASGSLRPDGMPEVRAIGWTDDRHRQPHLGRRCLPREYASIRRWRSKPDIDVEVLKREIKKTYAQVSTSRRRSSSSRPGEPGRSTSATRPSYSPGARDCRRIVRRRREPILARSAAPASGARPRLRGRHRLPRRRTDDRPDGPRHRHRHDAGDGRQGAGQRPSDGRDERRVLEGEAEQLPFEDESFDVVISNGVIDLIPDKDAVFAELYRVLRPADDSSSPMSPSSGRSARKAGATSTSGPAELPALCWKQSTPASSSGTASNGSRPATSSTPTPARPSRTRAARPPSSARSARQ